MFRLLQHGPNHVLIDIQALLEDLDQFFSIDQWVIEVPWCLWARGETYGEMRFEKSSFSDSQFRQEYALVYQTIDGTFEVLSGAEVVAVLRAVDSSYWEVTSSLAFESHLASKYCEYLH